jgi:hypothetical protein
MVAAKKAVAKPITATVSIVMGAFRNSVAARAHIDSGGHHGGRVDESGHWGRASHRVGQPDIQRNLRRLSGGAHQQQQRDDGENPSAGFRRHAFRRIKHFREVERAELPEYQEYRQRETKVADAVDDECLVPGGGGKLLREVESDQQIAAQPHAFPADE